MLQEGLYHVHGSPPLDLVVSQMNSNLVISDCLCNINFNRTRTLRSPSSLVILKSLPGEPADLKLWTSGTVQHKKCDDAE
jgi:hypothetical protein